MFLFGVKIVVHFFEHLFGLLRLLFQLHEGEFTCSNYVSTVKILRMTFSSMSSNCAFSSFSSCWYFWVAVMMRFTTLRHYYILDMCLLAATSLFYFKDRKYSEIK